MIEYENTLKNTTLKFNSFGNNIRKAIFIWQTVYGIPKDSQITLKHVLGITFYILITLNYLVNLVNHIENYHHQKLK